MTKHSIELATPPSHEGCSPFSCGYQQNKACEVAKLYILSEVTVTNWLNRKMQVTEVMVSCFLWFFFTSIEFTHIIHSVGHVQMLTLVMLF